MYYKQAAMLAELPRDTFWAEISRSTISSDPVRAIYFTRTLAVLLYFTQANYWIASVYFSFISFLGTLYFVKQIGVANGQMLRSVFVAFLFFPSIVFWSSGLMKESLAFASLMFLSGFYIKVKNGKIHWQDGLGLLTSVLILALLKNYILVVALPVFLILVQDHYFRKYHKNFLGSGLRVLVISLLLLLIGYLFGLKLFPNFEPDTLLSDIEISRQFIYQYSPDSFNIHSYSGLGVLDFAINTFYYLFSSLFRPLLFESWDFPIWLASIENSFILLMLIWKIAFTRWRFEATNFEGFTILIYALFMGCMLAYSLPNLGTVSRMKVYYMPFLLWLILNNHPIWDKWTKIKILR